MFAWVIKLEAALEMVLRGPILTESKARCARNPLGRQLSAQLPGTICQCDKLTGHFRGVIELRPEDMAVPESAKSRKEALGIADLAA